MMHMHENPHHVRLFNAKSFPSLTELKKLAEFCNEEKSDPADIFKNPGPFQSGISCLLSLKLISTNKSLGEIELQRYDELFTERKIFSERRFISTVNVIALAAEGNYALSLLDCRRERKIVENASVGKEHVMNDTYIQIFLPVPQQINFSVSFDGARHENIGDVHFILVSNDHGITIPLIETDKNKSSYQASQTFLIFIGFGLTVLIFVRVLLFPVSHRHCSCLKRQQAGKHVKALRCIPNVSKLTDMNKTISTDIDESDDDISVISITKFEEQISLVIDEPNNADSITGTIMAALRENELSQGFKENGYISIKDEVPNLDTCSDSKDTDILSADVSLNLEKEAKPDFCSASSIQEPTKKNIVNFDLEKLPQTDEDWRMMFDAIYACED